MAALVAAPSLTGGFALDDCLHRALLRSEQPFNPWWDLFNFGSGDVARLTPWIQRGPFPWFTLPTLKIHFFRPLASALIALDFKLFGDAAWAAHLHSLLWYLALVAIAATLYRRLGPPWAGLASVLFCLDDAHTMPVAWLANRNSLLSVTFVWLGLLAHLRWREDGWKPGRWASVLAWLVGLSAGETAVSALAYVVTYELFGRTGPVRERLRALGGLALVLSSFAVMYVASNSGASGSATYVDPLRETWQYLQVVPVRALAMLGGWTFAVSPDAWIIVPKARPVLLVGGLASLVLWPLLWKGFAPTEEHERRTLRWLTLGAAAALLPGLATFPTNRLLLAPSLGLGALLAALFRRAWAERARLRNRVVLAWALLAFGLEPLLSWMGEPVLLRRWNEAVAEGLATAPIDLTGRVVLLTSSDLMPPIFGPALLSEQGRAEPVSWNAISFAPHAHRLSRTGERQLELEVVEGHLLETVFEQNVRNEGHRFAVGDQVPLQALTITVLELEQGWPRRLRLDFARPLEDFQFASWRGLQLVPVAPPPLGQSVELPFAPTVAETLLTN